LRKYDARETQHPGRSGVAHYLKALSGERSPDFDTILKVVNALGLRLHAEAAQG